MIYLNCGIDVSDIHVDDIERYLLSIGFSLGKRVNQIDIFIKYVNELPVEIMVPVHDNFSDIEIRKEDIMKFIMQTQNLVNPYTLIEDIRRLRSM